MIWMDLELRFSVKDQFELKANIAGKTVKIAEFGLKIC